MNFDPFSAQPKDLQSPQSQVNLSPTATAPIASSVSRDTWRTSREKDYMLMNRIHRVAFFGYADAQPDSQLYKDTFATAQLFAKQGLTIVDGGGPGVMDASTKGAQSVGGETIAVTFYPKDATGFEGRYVGNIASKEIVTRNYIERMFKLMENADAYIIFNGGTGTISELGTAWVMARLYYGHHKPFILFGSFWRDIVNVFEQNMMMRGNERDVLRIVETPEQALFALQMFDLEMEQMDHKRCAICQQIEDDQKKSSYPGFSTTFESP